MLVPVPVVFVVIAARSMAEAAKLLGGTGPSAETALAGWAAGFLAGEPPDWAWFLPGYGADRVLLDGGLTASFDETGPLLLGLGLAAPGLFRKAIA